MVDNGASVYEAPLTENSRSLTNLMQSTVYIGRIVTENPRTGTRGNRKDGRTQRKMDGIRESITKF